jgi:transcriptional regulator with XRE-family HTH domain
MMRRRSGYGRTAVAKRITQTELAERTLVPLQALGRYWRGESAVGVSDLLHIITALDETDERALREIRALAD